MCSRYYKGNHGAEINSRDVIQIIGDFFRNFDILSAPIFWCGGAFTDNAVIKRRNCY